MPGLLIAFFIIFGVVAIVMNVRWWQRYRNADPEEQDEMRTQARRWQRRNMMNRQMNQQQMNQNPPF